MLTSIRTHSIRNPLMSITTNPDIDHSPTNILIEKAVNKSKISKYMISFTIVIIIVLQFFSKVRSRSFE